MFLIDFVVEEAGCGQEEEVVVGEWPGRIGDGDFQFPRFGALNGERAGGRCRVLEEPDERSGAVGTQRVAQLGSGQSLPVVGTVESRDRRFLPDGDLPLKGQRRVQREGLLGSLRGKPGIEVPDGLKVHGAMRFNKVDDDEEAPVIQQQAPRPRDG
ncbi:MAG: hypothetical protein RL648_1634, partial [Verrucomicrobiota bacterium]